MDASKCAKGPWKAEHGYYELSMEVRDKNGRRVCLVPCDFPVSPARVEAHAELIAEAGTVATETGLSPRQLAERIKTLESELAGWEATQ